MKIIKKQPDFYDSVLGYGVDNTIVYIREETEVEVIKGWYNSLFNSNLRTRGAIDVYNAMNPVLRDLIEKLEDHHFEEGLKVKNQSIDAVGYYIVFAGELIPLIRIKGTIGYYPNAKEIEDYVYTKEQFVSALEKHLDSDQVNKILEQKHWYSEKHKLGQKVDLFFAQRKEGMEDFHHEFDCPLVLIKKKGYVKNPILKKLNFGRCYDAFTTYQKLEMFISGVLGGQSPKMVEIDDIHRIAGHGFDTKMSFRKRKE